MTKSAMTKSALNQAEREQLCAFFRRSHYDILQARVGEGGANGWGPVFTFVPCDARAARKAAQMLQRLHRGTALQVRHARRARLRDRRQQTVTDVVVVTELPGRAQTVIRMENAIVVSVSHYLQDEALAALEVELRSDPTE